MKNFSCEAPSSKLKDWIKSHSDVLHNPWAGSYYLVNIKSVHFNRLTIADGFHKYLQLIWFDLTQILTN